MSPAQAAVLGVVEGLTEYLPVSSTGHLILAQRAMGLGADEDKEAADAYAIVIQLGAILAVLGLYAGHVRRMARGLAGRDPEGLRLARNLAAAFAPAAVVGILFADAIKQHLFGLWPVVMAWFAGGAAILAVGRWRKGHRPRTGVDLFTLTWRQALVIGLCQCLAAWPGTSRSLVTIVAGLLVGMPLGSAVVFSFLLGMITLGASTLYDALQHGALLLGTYGWASLLTGLVAALVSALLAVKWMVGYLARHGMALFGFYRIAIAAVVSALLLAGWLDAA
jgi:undecaprenyl-diphosphatase